MKKPLVAKYAFLVLLVLASLIATVAAVKSTRLVEPLTQDPRPTPQAILRTGSQEVVVTNRHVRRLDDPRWRQQVDIEWLARNSSIILVGIPTRNICRLSNDGQMVTTDYQVVTREVLKSDMRLTETITVSLPGGLIRNSDDSFTEVQTPTFRKMRNRNTYVLFLSPDETRRNVFVPTAGPQGLYELPTNGTGVRHLGRAIDLPLDDPAAPDVESFLSDLRTIISSRRPRRTPA